MAGLLLKRRHVSAQDAATREWPGCLRVATLTDGLYRGVSVLVLIQSSLRTGPRPDGQAVAAVGERSVTQLWER